MHAIPTLRTAARARYSLPVTLLVLLLVCSCASRRPFIADSVNAQADQETAVADAAAFQADLSETYLDPERTILSESKLARLQALGGLNFYPIDPAYVVVADFTRYSEPEIIEMKTSSARLAEFRVYGRATFELQGEELALDVYETTNPNVPEEYAGLLFLPFRDATSGKETYGGGRYIDLPSPEGDELLIDFNQAYQPYCAYSDGFSCPVPPAQNDMTVAIRAGVRTTELGD
ncbi:hypothetical protein LEM8419_00996 [Neolewinella maritima]|uniref:DUF1684 domain-containing protein n=1 Tax=Neolewinella maritima TaxID=1383882 RepID=A0ABN8F078_9BACT|nr:DUF1684 domain-containing protein [Neolewinella maritima]CAH0999696.1 hypothetical protein LEM8419_00996 [Neolewinella maritima]